RILGVDVEEPASWRVVGLARLTVRTASGGGDDTVLDAVARPQVATLVATLTGAPPAIGDRPAASDDTTSADAPPPPRAETLYAATVADLALAGMTGRTLAGIGVLAAVAGRVLDGLDLRERAVERARTTLPTLLQGDLPPIGSVAITIVGLAGLALLVALPLAALVSLVRLGGLTITRENGAIVRRAGRLERTEQRVPAGAVRGLRIVASPLRRLAGGAALVPVTATQPRRDDDDDDTGVSGELVPFLRRAPLERLAAALLPAAGPLLAGPWRRVGVTSAAWPRALVALVLCAATIGIVDHVVVPPAATGATWLLLVPAVALAVAHIDGRRRTAIACDTVVESPLLGVTWGTLVRTTALLAPHAAQSVHRTTGPVQRRAGLCSLRIAFDDGDAIRLPDIPVGEADALERRIREATSRVLPVSPRGTPAPHAPISRLEPFPT
ncbi:MAG: PH domain-containing protein, partial [Gemmatimonadaceae bacterium]|nr:PH domain-containing protein [Gemmatimonadaceae bacterium]